MVRGARPATIVALGVGSVAAATLLVWLATTAGDEDTPHALPPPPPPSIAIKIDPLPPPLPAPPPPPPPLPPPPADDASLARRQAIDQARSAGVLGSSAFANGTVRIGPPPTAALAADYKDTVRREVRRHVPRVRLCYERRLPAVPDLQGTVRTSFTIQRDGSVTDVTAMGLDSEVADCIAGVLHSLTFTAPDGGGKVQINYPFTFASTP
jgi:outer membrane biosynthesis protein TonB